MTKYTMKVLGILWFVFLTPHILFSQNLVTNPGFECGNDPCHATTDYQEYVNYACGWSCPTRGTSDIFSSRISDNECFSSMPYNGVAPLDHWGSQSPRTGKRFGGLIPCIPQSFLNSAREYLQVELTTPLIPGEYYCAEMYVSAGDFVNYSCNNMGMYFSDTKTTDDVRFGLLPFTPQIEEQKLISDKSNWVRIFGTFKATSPAKYLIIGNFKADAETVIVHNPSTPDYDLNFAYYFIDDVSVERIPNLNFAFPDNVEICESESTTLKAGGGFDNITWTTLSDTLAILSSTDSLRVAPLFTTQYRVSIRACNLTIKDTITISVTPFLKVDLGNDTTICEGTTIELNAGAIIDGKYRWQDQSTAQYLKVTEAGKYGVMVSSSANDCEGYDEIDVSIKKIPDVNLGNDVVSCKGFLELSAGPNHNTYEWSDGSTDSVFTPTTYGEYWVSVENQCGQSKDSIQIYSLEQIFVPNVVTANGDSVNSEFQLAIVEDQSQKRHIPLSLPGKLTIFNRWGSSIFSDESYIKGWPGNNNVDAGVYYFTFSYPNCPVYKGLLHVLK